MKVTDLSFSAGDKFLVKRARFSLDAGKIISIIGQNGVGKSSLLRILAGLDKKYQGDVEINQQNLRDISVVKLAKIRSYMSQSLETSFPFKSSEIVKMACDDGDILDQVLEATNTVDLKDRRFPSLSGGEKQRIHLAQALAQIWHQEDAYLMLDEPLSAQDLKHQINIMELLRKLRKEKNIAVIMINHLIDLSVKYSDQFIIIDNQKIQVSNQLDDSNIKEIFNLQ